MKNSKQIFQNNNDLTLDMCFNGKYSAFIKTKYKKLKL